jgi:hypothetical protein
MYHKTKIAFGSGHTNILVFSNIYTFLLSNILVRYLVTVRTLFGSTCKFATTATKTNSCGKVTASLFDKNSVELQKFKPISNILVQLAKITTSYYLSANVGQNNPKNAEFTNRQCTKSFLIRFCRIPLEQSRMSISFFSSNSRMYSSIFSCAASLLRKDS